MFFVVVVVVVFVVVCLFVLFLCVVVVCCFCFLFLCCCFLFVCLFVLFSFLLLLLFCKSVHVNKTKTIRRKLLPVCHRRENNLVTPSFRTLTHVSSTASRSSPTFAVSSPSPWHENTPTQKEKEGGKKNQQLWGDWETGRKGKGKTCQQCFRVSELVNVEPGSEMSTATCHVLQPVTSAREDSGSRWNGGICPRPEKKKEKKRK